MIKRISLIALVLVTVIFSYISIYIIVDEIDTVNYYQKITTSDLTDVVNQEKYTIVYFYKDDCSPCISFKKVLNRVIQEKELSVYAIDVKDSRNDIYYSSFSFDIEATPTLIIYKGKDEVDRNVGMMDKKSLEEFIGRYLNQ